MGKEYIVNGAKATCKYGKSIGVLQVNDNTGVSMNGSRTATTKTLGNTFTPNFGSCSAHHNCPCIPNIVNDSVGTCVLGSPNCISFQHTGQYNVLGAFDFSEIPTEHIADICPIADIL